MGKDHWESAMPADADPAAWGDAAGERGGQTGDLTPIGSASGRSGEAREPYVAPVPEGRHRLTTVDAVPDVPDVPDVAGTAAPPPEPLQSPPPEPVQSPGTETSANTHAGMPRRVRRLSLASELRGGTPATGAAGSPEAGRARSVMSSMQNGWRRGRTENTPLSDEVNVDRGDR
jgi:hypothetical protein